MRFAPHLAEIRFGCGLSPEVAAPASVDDMLARLTGPDTAAARFPVADFATFRQHMIASEAVRKEIRRTRGTPEFEIARKARNDVQRAAREDQSFWHQQRFFRRVWTPDGFRERLVWFWADHFTAVGKGGTMRRGASPYVEDAIRPNITGTFADLLIAAVTNPMMLQYLDQHLSAGPNSPHALRRQGKTGLNENLAREVLELHTLGVGAPYTQGDVRELAELFTGLYFDAQNGFKFQKNLAEPGADTVLGRSYGGAKPDVSDVYAVLRDLAAHPATAAHVARKLAVHFLSDTPDPGYVSALEKRFRDTGGNLLAVYEVLLTHPAAWEPALQNVKQPWEFMTSAARALAVRPARFANFEEKERRFMLHEPLVRMGQRWENAPGPDGWDEDDAAWIDPQGLAARIGWAMRMPVRLRPDLPDPREFVHVALGPLATGAVVFAAEAAENRREGVGLILTSPAFQRK